ncbi:MAG: AhpC/TSA family protein [Flavobacteriales bacterium]|nr:AhpC/TSA family protein [Flavobacteriales bacterium]
MIYTLLFFLSVGFTNSFGQIAEQSTDISPLLIGESIPETSLTNLKGEKVSTNDIFGQKPTVLVVYRGSWCPYCNRHLSALAQAEDEIIALGYQIVAISPDDYQNLQPTTEENELKYQLYSDGDGSFIQQTGLAFKASKGTQKYISSKTIGKTTEILPVPAVFVLNKKAEILFEYISPNYKVRMTKELLMAVLKSLEI